MHSLTPGASSAILRLASPHRVGRTMLYRPSDSWKKFGRNCQRFGSSASGILEESSQRSISPTPVRKRRPQHTVAKPQQPSTQQMALLQLSAAPFRSPLTRFTISCMVCAFGRMMWSSMTSAGTNADELAITWVAGPPRCWRLPRTSPTACPRASGSAMTGVAVSWISIDREEATAEAVGWMRFEGIARGLGTGERERGNQGSKHHVRCG